MGSLSNDDGDGNDNGKKAIGLVWQKKQLRTYITLFCTVISLPSLHEYDVKITNFMFCRGRRDKTKNFFSFPEL